MTFQRIIFSCSFFLAIAICFLPPGEWKTENYEDYQYFYQKPDKKSKKDYLRMLDKGILATEDFFKDKFKNRFFVYIHPNRQSLDSQWRLDWKIPDFRSECWMVASGVANKLDIISPATWEKESCEHSYSDRIKTQQLVTHELIHVYHGQQNASPDFSDTEKIDWFVEGLAGYASEQLDSSVINTVRALVKNNETPASLDDFWKGKHRYGLSGSVVMYIDHVYGRVKLKTLLSLNKKSEILGSLNTTEEQLLSAWKEYMLQ